MGPNLGPKTDPRRAQEGPQEGSKIRLPAETAPGPLRDPSETPPGPPREPSGTPPRSPIELQESSNRGTRGLHKGLRKPKRGHRQQGSKKVEQRPQKGPRGLQERSFRGPGGFRNGSKRVHDASRGEGSRRIPGGLPEEKKSFKRASEGLHPETETHQPGPFQEIQRKGPPNSTSALIQRHRVSYTQAVQTASFSPR